AQAIARKPAANREQRTRIIGDWLRPDRGALAGLTTRPHGLPPLPTALDCRSVVTCFAALLT
ncbi:MAG: hypothetical protein WB689_38445, partial [Xanthobacteraceae bacterium]